MRDKIVIIEALIFGLPFLVLLSILYQGGYRFGLPDVIQFGVIAIFVLAGMMILRQILDRVSRIATSLRKAESGEAVTIDINKDIAELHEISASFNNLLKKSEQINEDLARKNLVLSVIKDLTGIVKSNLDVDDQLNLLLQKSMAITGARIGSVFVIEPETRQKSLASLKSAPMSVSSLYRFRVAAAKGHGEELKKDSLIDIDSSLAKAVLLERGPLLVKDIEKDPRTHKVNDPKYGPPSFLSMPIFIAGNVAIILNLACKEQLAPFDSDDEQMLSILLREVDFAFENALMQSKFSSQIEKINAHTIELEKELEVRRRVEEALRDSEKKYRELVEFLPIPLFEITLEGKILSGNPAIFQAFGYTQEDFEKGLNVLQMCVPEDWARAQTNIQRVLNGERSSGTECTLIRKDGSTFPAIIFASPIIYRSTPVGLRGVIIDITKRKTAEDELRESEARLRAVLESVQAGILIIDFVTHEIVDANPAAVNMIGAPKEQIVGSICHKYICPAEKGRCPITDLGQSVDKSERILLTANGENRPILKTVAPVTFRSQKHLLECFIDRSSQNH